MKNNQNNKTQDFYNELLEGSGFAADELLEIKNENGVCIMIKAQMTALEVAEVITTLTNISSDLTVALAAACGLCDNCGEQRDAAPNSRTITSANPYCPARNEGDSNAQCSEACEFLNGCKDTPTDWVRNCSLCQDPFNKDLQITVPDYVLEDAGIPKGAKLEAYADEDSGEIVVVESDCQQDITDMPEGIVAILAASGVCLAELDELIMMEEIVYGA